MTESQSNSIQKPQKPVESADRPAVNRRPNTWLPFIFTEAVLASPIALAAGIAIFQLIKTGGVSPETDFWLRGSLLFSVPIILLAALHLEVSRD